MERQFSLLSHRLATGNYGATAYGNRWLIDYLLEEKVIQFAGRVAKTHGGSVDFEGHAIAIWRNGMNLNRSIKARQPCLKCGTIEDHTIGQWYPYSGKFRRVDCCRYCGHEWIEEVDPADMSYSRTSVGHEGEDIPF